MKRIVVSGATSMIGVALIKECLSNAIEVLAIVRRKSAHIGRLPQSDLIRICECNLEELDKIANVGSKHFDVFYHFAWDYTSKKYRDNPEFQERNIKYTLDAVKLAKRLGCNKFVGAGSQAEYGKVDGVIKPETKIKPQTSYGMAKYAAGTLSRKLCEQLGMIHIWGRIFSVYGCLDNDDTMLVYAVDQLLKGLPVRFSAATQMWDYLHENDAGKIFFLIGKCANKSKVYCIANGEARPLREFINELADVIGEENKCEFEKETHMNTISLQADVRELMNDINYKPQVGFREGITEMIQYRRKFQGQCNLGKH